MKRWTKTWALSLAALATLVLGTWVVSTPSYAKAIEGVVNVNTASPEELSLLPGVGPAKAAEIVATRQAKPFASLEDLSAVKGLGPKRLEAMKDHVSFSGATTAKSISNKKTVTQKSQQNFPNAPAKSNP